MRLRDDVSPPMEGGPYLSPQAKVCSAKIPVPGICEAAAGIALEKEGGSRRLNSLALGWFVNWTASSSHSGTCMRPATCCTNGARPGTSARMTPCSSNAVDVLPPHRGRMSLKGCPQSASGPTRSLSVRAAEIDQTKGELHFSAGCEAWPQPQRGEALTQRASHLRDLRRWDSF